MKKRWFGYSFAILAMVCLTVVFFLKSGEAKIPLEKKAKLGTSYQITKEGAKYRSSDTSVAYVDAEGRVTTKKIGEAVIRIRTDEKTWYQHLTVVANGKKTKKIDVSSGEVAVRSSKISYKTLKVEGGAAEETPLPEETPMVEESLAPTESPVPEESLEPTESPAPEESPVPEESVVPEESLAPTESPVPEESPVPTEDSLPEETIAPTEAPTPEPTPAPVPKVQFTVSVKLKNIAEEAATKVVLYGKVGENICKLNFGEMDAGEAKTEKISQVVDAVTVTPGEEMQFIKLAVYSNKMYTVYHYKKQKTTFHYATKDKKAPVISGFVGKNSYNGKMPYMVVYSDDKDYDYFQYVTAEDDREGKVTLTVNTKKVNFKKAGIYRITYCAVDKAGNVAKKKAKIEIRKAKDLDGYADEVLSEITKPNWTIYKKATAIYDYTRNHISYTGSSNKKSWEKEAVRGLREGTGDCFTYYAVARALLTRAGIPNIEVTRYRGVGHHWWNMVYVKGGWYHYDCGPRKAGGRFCMVTDSQLTQYSKTHGNKYIWNYSAIPKSATKKLTTIF